MSEYIFIEPNKNKGEGARSREACFVRLTDPRGDNEVVRGDLLALLEREQDE